MRRTVHALTIALLALGAGCHLLVHDHDRSHDRRHDRDQPHQAPPPAPHGETHAPAPAPAPGPYAHLPQRTSFTTKSDTELKPGCYAGDFVLGRVQLRVKGAGCEQTVIDGNLVLDTQCEVCNLTVLGDVVFKGNQASLKNVDFRGRVIDHGVQNRY
jgi:hypothetical protein